MQHDIRYLGLDVSRAKIAVGVAEGVGGEPWYRGTIVNTPEAVGRLIRGMRQDDRAVVACYEAGFGGLTLYRRLTAMGVECLVAAPSRIPQAPGDRVKTDRRDALKLARLLRSGDLQPAYTPSPEDEVLRDLTRMRERAVHDTNRARNRLTLLLHRWGIEEPPAFKKRWTQQYRAWLNERRFEEPYRTIFFEHVQAITQGTERIQRSEAIISRTAKDSHHAELILAVQAFRGIQETTAVALIAEVGDLKRFPSPRHLMGYAGLGVREYSSGSRVRRGASTRTGNTHFRYLLTEAAWHYLRVRPDQPPSAAILARRKGLPPACIAIAEAADARLPRRFRRLAYHNNKALTVACVAVARELAGFIWAMARACQETESV